MTGVFGEKIDFKQESGPDVPLVVYGDEYYARYETEDGYTVVYDPEFGLYCYAVLKNGKFTSSGIPVSQPPPPGLPTHLEEADSVRFAKAAAKVAARTPPDEGS